MSSKLLLLIFAFFVATVKCDWSICGINLVLEDASIRRSGLNKSNVRLTVIYKPKWSSFRCALIKPLLALVQKVIKELISLSRSD